MRVRLWLKVMFLSEKAEERIGRTEQNSAAFGLISVQGLKTEDRLLCQEEDRGGPQTAKTEYEMFISIIDKAVSEVDHQKLKLKSRN
jgi:hypothetical protein